MPQEQTSKSNEAGFVTVEILGALLVVTIILSIVYSLWSTELIEMQKRAVAKHFETVSNAVLEYGAANKEDLLNDSDNNSGRNITIIDLKNDDFLPDGFNAKNAWKQSYAIYSREITTGKLQFIILTTGGRSHNTNEPEFGNLIIPSTAAITTIGFIPVGSQNTLRGAYNAWEINLEDMGIPDTVREAGHIGNLITVGASGETGGGSEGPELDMTGKVDSIQFDSTSMETIKNLCKDPANNGMLFFNKDKGLHICRKNEAREIEDDDID